ncbi:MAG TPA: PDZ domain-containing protein [Gemmatales bacterium]|nr:PDZ domain-containing protein [Gemmatales bacterium]
MKKIYRYLLAVSLAIMPMASTWAQPSWSWQPGWSGSPRQDPWPDRVVEGLRITWVAPGSPAMRAGLQRGDILMGVDGRNLHSTEQLQRALLRTGHSGVVKYWDAESRRIRYVRVFPQQGIIGVQVVPVMPRWWF